MNSTPPKPGSEKSPSIQAAGSKQPTNPGGPMKIPTTPTPATPVVVKKRSAPQASPEKPLEKTTSPSTKELALEAGIQKSPPETAPASQHGEPQNGPGQKKDGGKNGRGPTVPMRSLLNDFAVEFCDQIDPLCLPLTTLGSLVTELPASSSMHKILPELRDVRHHIQALLEKVKEQQAYVLIFGPLKSGKSTLMNAICASYVSEVTSLPAYPCLVNISYGEKPEYRAVQYDGKIQTFAGQDDLHNTIEQAHEDLTSAIREVEGKGQNFDPAEHMPAAFRNIDIKLSTPELATSSAVLVDTPGLYSRMKFGYDQMTRDFRNTAACAIFVVKSDNLFLEQVFEEFTELLELFSRIFLIVNLDSRKMDLDAKGELTPSLEKKDPEKIIQAFRNLAMSAPLKEAVDDGRLRIYPVDLLSAASGRIQASKDSQPDAGGDKVSVEQFDSLRDDLISFLNSNDYLKSFLVDSVRRGSSLMDSVLQFSNNPAFVQAAADREKLESEKKLLVGECQALANLVAEDWHKRSSGLVKDLAAKTRVSAQTIEQSTETQIAEILERWWQDNTSLQDLVEQQIRPCFEKKAQSYLDEVSQSIALKTANEHAGLEIGETLVNDLQTLKIDLRALGENALESTRPDSLTIDWDLDHSEIPVRKRFLDWLLLRGARRVKKDVFGPEEEPTKAIPPVVKEKRLGEPARAAIRNQCREYFAGILEQSTQSLPKESVGKYVTALIEDITGICEVREAKNKGVITEKEKLIEANAAVLKENESIKRKTTEIEQFLKENYPLPAWPGNQSS